MWFEQAWAVFRKDLLLEARTRANANAMLFFAIIVLFIFSFALGPDRSKLQDAAGGLLWLAVTFAGLLAFGRAYLLETDNSAFEGLLLVAQSRSAIYAGKVLGATAVMVAIEAVILPLMAILYDIPVWGALPGLLLVAVLGTVGFAAIGAVYGALTMSLRAREVLLPLLLLPIVVPVLLAAVKASGLLLSGHTDGLLTWVEVLVVFDVVFLTVGGLTYEYAVGE